MTDVLQVIKDLQLTKRAEAEQLLLGFMRDTLGLKVTQTRLTPKPTSLNSFNGFVTFEDGSEKFFKTHTENNTVIQEYYNAELLARVGYPIIQPTFQSTTTGQQILLYDIIHHEAVFDLCWHIENTQSIDWQNLATAQNSADVELLKIYRHTLGQDASPSSPIHQLFYHRLVGGRMDNFYMEKTLLFPNGEHAISDLETKKWVINEQVYENTLYNIIERAIRLLNPIHCDAVSVIGHGDAHNGNVFFVDENVPSLLYFDPAFAGKHHPLLDLAKPLFHNVFAMWMYYPNEKASQTQVKVEMSDNTVSVDYDYLLHGVRKMFFESKIDNVLIPMLKLLKAEGLLRDDWRAFLKSALFCCPYLTMNLADRERFPAKIALLGLTMAIEMGAESSIKLSYLDEMLNRAENAL